MKLLKQFKEELDKQEDIVDKALACLMCLLVPAFVLMIVILFFLAIGVIGKVL